MKIATWNVYWLGDRGQEHADGQPKDEQTIAQVIAHLTPDVLALQEIVDPVAMERILELVRGPGRDYALRIGDTWLTSERDPAAVDNPWQKTFLCINRETVEFLHGAAIRGGPKNTRRPYAAALRHRVSGTGFVAVAVHLRAGYDGGFLNKEDAAVREQEATALANWLGGQAADENPEFPRPEFGECLVLGDFNAELQDPNHSLAGLALPGWTWYDPVPDGAHWETALYEGDQYKIDLMLLSPEMVARVQSAPAVYAWDYDPALGGPGLFHEGPGGTGPLRQYRVSDHRPVWMEMTM